MKIFSYVTEQDICSENHFYAIQVKNNLQIYKRKRRKTIYAFFLKIIHNKSLF